MPYSKDKLPDNLPSNFTDEQIDTFIATANSALDSGSDEGEAIAIGISQANSIKKSNKLSNIIGVLHTLMTYAKSEESEDDEDINEILEGDYGNKKGKKISQGIAASKDNYNIVKFNDEEMVAIEPLYAMPMESDAHGEGMTAEQIDAMVNNINININNIKGNIAHQFNTEGFHFVKAWVNQCDCYIGEEYVPEGQPIIKVQFTNEKLWDMRKSGKLQGLSIGAIGKRVDNPEYSEE